jgi:hypothetical protein
LDDLRRDIADLDADIQQYKAMLDDEYKPSGMAGIKIQLTTLSSHVEKIAVRRADYACTLEKTLKRLQDILASIEWVIRHFTVSEREVYRMKYIEKREMYDVAVRVGVIKRKAKYIDECIVQDIQRHYENMQKK